MIQLYISPSCSSCRKVKKYFDNHGIPYMEKNILNAPISKEESMRMLTKSENGFEDIISTRSNVFKEKGNKIEQMKTSELVDFIIDNPSVLKRPIIVADYELQVGYNEEDITLFLPQDKREAICSVCLKNNPEDCDYIKHLRFSDK